MLNLIGIDFEDWFHPELIQRHLTSKKNEPKVINGLDKILDLLRLTNTYATFFVVGELIKFKPEILDKILGDGHEIGFHTMYHTRLDSPNYKEKFLDEVLSFAELTSRRSKGFRAPTFSLNKSSSWVIDILSQNNYVYDSSIVPAKSPMYGFPDAELKPYKITSSSLEKNDPLGKMLEFPLLITKFFGKKIPAGGGFYLRVLPKKIIMNAIKSYEKKEIPSTIYIHSWELTPEYMPRISLPFKENFITYHNIEKAFFRLKELLHTFEFTSFSRYISQMKNLN